MTGRSGTNGGLKSPTSCIGVSTKPVQSFDDFKATMVGLFSAVGRTLPAEGWVMWYQVLGDLALPALHRAVVRWLAECDSGFPTPAAIRRLATEAEHGLLPDATEAFGTVCRALRSISWEWDADRFRTAVGPLAFAALHRCGGPQWFADMHADQRATFAAQFRRAYESLIERQEQVRRLPESLRPKRANLTPVTQRLTEAFSLPDETP
jgi:hypothetical protein